MEQDGVEEGNSSGNFVTHDEAALNKNKCIKLVLNSIGNY